MSEAGYHPVTYDNLTTGHEAFVQWGPLERGDIRDGARLDVVLAAHRPCAIIHLAGLIEVAASCRDPGLYFEVNVGGALTLIEAARRASVEAMVFSSTCATYGDPVRLPMDETHPQVPLNPYGRSKLMVEQALADYSAHAGFRSMSLRYFNAAGADLQGRIGERRPRESHVLPLAIQAALDQGAGFTLFGDDHDSHDGTAVRDYIHVLDLAEAHVQGLRYLIDGGQTTALNLGTGTGTSVAELIAAIRRRTGQSFPFQIASRRLGDAACLVADIKRARDVLGWAPTRNLDDILASAWAWQVAESRCQTAVA